MGLMKTTPDAAVPKRAKDNERPLIDDIRLLGRILGDVIREQEGAQAFELIEKIRTLSVAFRRDADHEADKALKKLLKNLSGDQAVSVIRAFTYFSHLANLAEDRHHIRRRTVHERMGDTQEGSIDVALSRLRWAGIAPKTIAQTLAQSYVSPVLTAHPTEVQRKSILDAERSIAQLLAQRDSIKERSSAFDSKKGNFVWDSYLKPEYRWFNGKVSFKTIGDKIDPSRTVEINHPEGGPDQPGARIWPFKVHRGKQAYDPENKNLLVVHTAGEDDTALWHNFDWPKAIQTGMRTAGLPWSGKYDFVATEMSWPLAHMVAPKGDAVPCAQCHSDAGRLQGIDGIYLPGRDRNRLLDMIGWSVVLVALLGVLTHGVIRICVLCQPKKG